MGLMGGSDDYAAARDRHPSGGGSLSRYGYFLTNDNQEIDMRRSIHKSGRPTWLHWHSSEAPCNSRCVLVDPDREDRP